MPYKIVQTLERGKTILVIVPSLWEESGSLWWPTKKTQYKLIKDEYSQPDKKEWKLMECFLKRNNIATYQLAEAELSIMENHSDTDVNDTDMFTPRTTVVQEEMQFEVMANQLRCDQENPSTDFGTDNNTNSGNILQIISTEPFNYDQILMNQKILTEKIDNILKIQTTTIENQQKIIQKLATQSVQIDELSAQIAEMKDGPPNVTMLEVAKKKEYTESFCIKPIQNQRDLISLDQKLADKEENKKLQTLLKFLCSTSKGSGKTCAYKLIDVIFTRDFLCHCSWAGGSRGDTSKIALKDYKNLLKFFHNMVQNWDPTYTVQENEQFFKIIAKNSNQRKCMKNLRMSSKRNRKNKKDEEEMSRNENDSKNETEKENDDDIENDDNIGSLC